MAITYFAQKLLMAQRPSRLQEHHRLMKVALLRHGAPTPQACQVSEFASKAHWTQRLSHLSFTALRALPRRKTQQPKSFFTSLSGQCKLMSASGSQGLKFSD